MGPTMLGRMTSLTMIAMARSWVPQWSRPIDGRLTSSLT
jgi:hypothetical protein